MGGEETSSPTGRKPSFDDHPRFLGVIFLVIGAIFGLVTFYFRMQDALQGAPETTIGDKKFAAFVIFTLTGLTLIILGPIAVRLAYKYAALSGWKKWLITGLIIVLYIGSVELAQHILEQYLSREVWLKALDLIKAASVW